MIVELLRRLRKQRESLIEDVMGVNKDARGTPKEELIARVVRVFTGATQIDLEAVEKEFLALGPDFALQDYIDDETIERDFMAALTKICWSRTGKSEDKVRREVSEEEMNEQEKIETEVYMAGRPFKEEASTLSMSLKKCTDMSTNRRVILPGNRTPKEEAILTMYNNH